MKSRSVEPPRSSARASVPRSAASNRALVQWLRDNLGLIDSAAEIENLAYTVDGELVMTLEFLEGETLRARLARGRLMRSARSAGWMPAWNKASQA